MTEHRGENGERQMGLGRRKHLSQQHGDRSLGRVAAKGEKRRAAAGDPQDVGRTQIAGPDGTQVAPAPAPTDPETDRHGAKKKGRDRQEDAGGQRLPPSGMRARGR